MPCMIITGYPASGKSAVVERIRQRALHLQLVEQVVIVSEHSAVGHNDNNNCNNNTDKEDKKGKTNHDDDNHGITSYYQDTLTEKKTRGALKAAFDRAVSNKATDKTLVILDALNYIKGVRYELHCISKAANQKHAVVWIVNDSYQTQQQSKQEQIIQELISRYEPPDARNRWDSPLYIVDLRQDDNNNNNSMKQVMEQTVYNMHQLSDALESGDKQPNDNNTAQQQQQQVKVPAQQQISNDIPLVVGGGDDDDFLNDSVAVAAATTKPKPTKTTMTTTKSGFKRNGFKRNTTVTNTVSSAEDQVHTPTNTFEPSGTSNSNNDPQSTIHENNKTRDDSTVSKKKSLQEQIDELLQDFLGDRVKPLQQGTSTVQHIASETDLLNRVDSLTQQVCRGIMTAQQQQQQQATTASSYSIIVHSVPYSFHGPGNITMATLRQWRKQYIQWMAAHPPPEKQSDAALVQSFLDFLQTQQQQQ